MSKKGIGIVSFIIKVVGGVVGLLIAKAVIDEVNRKTYCSVKGIISSKRMRMMILI